MGIGWLIEIYGALGLGFLSSISVAGGFTQGEGVRGGSGTDELLECYFTALIRCVVVLGVMAFQTEIRNLLFPPTRHTHLCANWHMKR